MVALIYCEGGEGGSSPHVDELVRELIRLLDVAFVYAIIGRVECLCCRKSNH